VRDVFHHGEAARVLSVMHVVAMLAPLLVPIVGGYVLVWFGWRAIFGVLAVFGAVCFLVVLWRLEETYPKERRASASVASAFAQYGHLLRDRKALGYVLCGSLSFAGMFAYITGTPFVYIEYFQVAPDHYGYLFALNIAGVIVATSFNAQVVKRVGTQIMLALGSIVAALSGVSLLTISVSEVGGLVGVVVPIFFFVSVTGLIGANCVARLLALYPQSAGVAAATFGAAQFGLGALASIAVGLLHDGSPVSDRRWLWP